MDYKYNPKTKRFSTKEEEKATPVSESVRVDKALIDKLAGCAKEDGFDLDGTNQSKRNKVVRLYAEKALAEFIAGRK